MENVALCEKTVRADRIKQALSLRHKEDVFLTEVKTGPTQGVEKGELKRLDAVAMKKSWSQPCITAYEVKVARADFLRDDKWPSYREYCHRLYFACPAGLIQPEELPEDVGLIWFNPERGTLYTKRKALFRDIELPRDMFYHLLISHTESDRHPFFSNQREYLEAWVEDKAERDRLGYLVKSKMYHHLRELEEKVSFLDFVKKEKDGYYQTLQAICEVLRKHGVYLHLGGLQYGVRGYEIEQIDKALSANIPVGVAKKVEELSKLVSSIESLVKEGTDKGCRASA